MLTEFDACVGSLAPGRGRAVLFLAALRVVLATAGGGGGPGEGICVTLPDASSSLPAQ